VAPAAVGERARRRSGGVNGGGVVRTGTLKALPVGAPLPTTTDRRQPRDRRVVEQGGRVWERASGAGARWAQPTGPAC
jgi:hypothetical protein